MRRVFFLTLLLVVSGRSFANDDWLSDYLQSRSVKCNLTHDQLQPQVTSKIDRNVDQIVASLKSSGSKFQLIQDRAHLEIGGCPPSSPWLFCARENVMVFMLDENLQVIKDYKFQIQTTHYADNTGVPTVQKGLWLPLTVKNPNADGACEIERASMHKVLRPYFPAVDLVIGEPPIVVAKNLAQIVDETSIATTPVRHPAPPSSPPSEKSEKNEKPQHHRERRQHEGRSHSSSHHRSRSRHRRHRIESPLQSSQPPPEQDECSGDVSPWKSLTCRLQRK